MSCVGVLGGVEGKMLEKSYFEELVQKESLNILEKSDAILTSC